MGGMRRIQGGEDLHHALHMGGKSPFAKTDYVHEAATAAFCDSGHAENPVLTE